MTAIEDTLEGLSLAREISSPSSSDEEVVPSNKAIRIPIPDDPVVPYDHNSTYTTRTAVGRTVTGELLAGRLGGMLLFCFNVLGDGYYDQFFVPLEVKMEESMTPPPGRK